MNPNTYPVKWLNEKVVIVHAGGEATGELTEVNLTDPIPFLLLKGDDGRVAWLPVANISYVSSSKRR